jgi:hypothetical protein
LRFDRILVPVKCVWVFDRISGLSSRVWVFDRNLVLCINTPTVHAGTSTVRQAPTCGRASGPCARGRGIDAPDLDRFLLAEPLSTVRDLLDLPY